MRIRIENELPEEMLCRAPNVENQDTKQRAKKILSDLAKHLIALKDSTGQLNMTAKRSYLQVRKKIFSKLDMGEDIFL